MAFRTKIDFSSNRQIKQHEQTFTELSGGTIFGLAFSAMSSGPNLNTTGITETQTFGVSTFSGNSGTTIYTWYDARMELGASSLSALTPLNSGITQNTGQVYTGTGFVTIDGNTSATLYTGVSFDISDIVVYDMGGGIYTGTVVSNVIDYLSAATTDFTGRTIWVDTLGITRTEKLIVTDNPQVGYVLTCIDSEGMASWSPSVTGSSFDVFVTGGSYSNGTAIFTNNTGGTFNVNGFSTGTTTYWSASTGLDAIVTKNSGSVASGDNSLAVGINNIASGDYSHAEGQNTEATGTASHAEGQNTNATASRAHAEGSNTTASGSTSHAEGTNTVAGGQHAHAEGFQTKALGQQSHAEGSSTQATGTTSHAEGTQSRAFGNSSHAEGDNTLASGDYSHSEGNNTIASGINSHSEGLNTIASAESSHAGGFSTQANGLSSFIHGRDSIVNGNYSIVLGRNITGNTANTTYVENLNIKNVPVGTPLNSLGIDSFGNVIQSLNLQKVITGDYTLTNADNNYLIFVNNGGTPVTITVPSGLVANFSAGFIQVGTADVSFVASGGGSILNANSEFKIKGTSYQVCIDKYTSSTTYYLLGNTKP